MKVLLVWEEVPENTKFYLLDGELAELAVRAHGCFVNTDLDPEGNGEALSEALVNVAALPQTSPMQMTEPVTVVTAGFVM